MPVAAVSDAPTVRVALPFASLPPPVPPAPPEPAPTVLEPAPAPEAPVLPGAGKKMLWVWSGAAGLVVVVLAILLGARLLKKQPAAAGAASTVPANLAANPPASAPPPPAELRVYTDLENAKVTLDGSEVGALEGGQFSLDNLSEGQHVLEIGEGSSQAKISLLNARGAMPQIQGTPEIKDLKAILIANGPQQGQVLSSYGPCRLRWTARRSY